MLARMSGTGSLEAAVGARAPDGDTTSIEDETATAPATEPETGAAAPRWLWWAGLVAVALPFVASAVAIFLDGGYHPSADVAQTEMYTSDVGRYQLLLGPFSRDGWYHPGPALYYVLALPYRLLGSSPSSLAAGALAVNGLSLVGIAAIAKRRGGTPLMLCMLLSTGLLVRAMGFEMLATPWNPWVTVLPYAFLVMLTWAMTCGERWALPVAALVATFVVQTHVGYAVLALPLAAFGALWLLAGEFRAWRTARAGAVGGHAAVPTVGSANGVGDAGDEATGAGHEVTLAGDQAVAAGDEVATAGSSRGVRWRAKGLVVALGVAAAVLVVAWLPPVVQQLTNEPGNLGVVARWFAENRTDGRTPGEGWATVTAQYAFDPEWLVGSAGHSIVGEPLYITYPRIPVLLLVVALAAVAGWKRPGGDARRLLGVWFVASALGFVAVVRTVGLLYTYRLAWAWTLGALAAGYCLWVGWTWLAARVAGIERRALVPALALAVVVVTGIDVASAVRAGIPEEERSARLGELGREVAAVLPDDAGPIRVVPTSYVAMGYAPGLMADLESRGFDTRRSGKEQFVTDHREPPAEPWATLQVVTDDGIPAAADNPDLEMLAYTGEMSVDELRTLAVRKEQLAARIREMQQSGEAIDPQDLAELAEDALPVEAGAAVFLVKSTAPPELVSG
jgi:hypothetical protein